MANADICQVIESETSKIFVLPYKQYDMKVCLCDTSEDILQIVLHVSKLSSPL